jgi:sec-independent protein translocase protein TatB
MFPEGRLLDFLIVGAVALIVVGPKDLPILMRKVGAFVAKMRGMAAEFRASFDELARQSELDELRAEVEAMRRSGPMEAAVAATGGPETQAVFDDIHAGLRSGQAQFPPVVSPVPNEPTPSGSDAESEGPIPKPPRKRKAATKARSRRKPATSRRQASPGTP